MPTRIGPKKPFRLFISEWREHRNLTQEQLARRVGTSDVTISRWETRKRQPDLNALAAIAEALDIEPFDLRRAIMR
jgi:transcriptional regulator with XRE-family HTH domain